MWCSQKLELMKKLYCDYWILFWSFPLAKWTGMYGPFSGCHDDIVKTHISMGLLISFLKDFDVFRFTKINGNDRPFFGIPEGRERYLIKRKDNNWWYNNNRGKYFLGIYEIRSIRNHQNDRKKLISWRTVVILVNESTMIDRSRKIQLGMRSKFVSFLNYNTQDGEVGLPAS